MVDPARERPAPAASGDGFSESWEFAAVFERPRTALVVRLTWWPRAGRAWYAAALHRSRDRWVVVLDDELELGRLNRSLEIRHEGIWASHHCERELERWTVGLEAFGVEVDDLDDLVDRGWGARTGLGLDLEWEATGPPWTDGGDRYEVPAAVHGEVLVDDEQHPDACGTGWWRRWWGQVGTDRRAWRADCVGRVREVAAPLAVGPQPTMRPAE